MALVVAHEHRDILDISTLLGAVVLVAHHIVDVTGTASRHLAQEEAVLVGHSKQLVNGGINYGHYPSFQTRPNGLSVAG